MGQGIFSHLCIVSFHASIEKEWVFAQDSFQRPGPGPAPDVMEFTQWALRPGRRELLLGTSPSPLAPGEQGHARASPASLSAE